MGNSSMKNLQTFLENSDNAVDRLADLKNRQDKFEKSKKPAPKIDPVEKEQLKKEIKNELAAEMS